MTSFKRPDSKIHFGQTGKPGSLQKQVKRDEIGELELTVIVADSGRTRINFNKPLTYLELTSDKAYDFAHLILEHVKDKQGGEPVNVTEEKVADAMERVVVSFGLDAKMAMTSRDLAVVLAEAFMRAMANEPEETKAANDAISESQAKIEGLKP